MFVSIIVLNYNTPDYTERCVKSISDNVKSQLYELIVVDNCSSNENKEKLRSKLSCFQQVKLVESDYNRGFGAGNMLGVNCAKGDYLCFINSDVKLIEDCVTPLCEFLKSHNDVGCVGAQQLTIEHQIRTSFGHGDNIRKEIFGKKFLEATNHKKYPKRKDCIYKQPIPVVFVSGALMVFPTKLFHLIGGFDENIFLFSEEYDLSMGLMGYGYKTMFLPMYSYLHINGGTTHSSKENRHRMRYEVYKSKLYVYKKHHNTFLYSIFLFINVVKLITKPKRWYVLKELYLTKVEDK